MSYKTKFLFVFCTFMLAGSVYADVWSEGKRNLCISDLTQARQGLVELQKTIRTLSAGISAGQYSRGYLRKRLADKQSMHNPYHFMDTTSWNAIVHTINKLDTFLSLNTKRTVAQKDVCSDCRAIDFACEQGKKEINSRIVAFGDYAKTKAHTISNPAQLTEILNKFKKKKQAQASQSRKVPSPIIQNNSSATGSESQAPNATGNSTNHNPLAALQDAGWSPEKIDEFNTLVEACKRNTTQESMQALGTFIQSLSPADQELAVEILPLMMGQADSPVNHDKGFFGILRENPKMFALLALSAAAFIGWRFFSSRDPGSTLGNWIRSFFAGQPVPSAAAQPNVNQQAAAPQEVQPMQPVEHNNREDNAMQPDEVLQNQGHQQAIPDLDPIGQEEVADQVQQPEVAYVVNPQQSAQAQPDAVLDNRAHQQQPIPALDPIEIEETEEQVPQQRMGARGFAWVKNWLSLDPVTDQTFALDRI